MILFAHSSTYLNKSERERLDNNNAKKYLNSETINLLKHFILLSINQLNQKI